MEMVAQVVLVVIKMLQQEMVLLEMQALLDQQEIQETMVQVQMLVMQVKKEI
jgi:hypothetical protein